MKLSNTNQRRVIIEELKKVTSHPTADEVYSMVRMQIPNISLGTVYRNLELLSKAGEIMKLETAGKQKRFDGTTHLHFHKRCTSCGKVEDISYKGLDEIGSKLNDLISENDLQSFNLELNGICESCRDQNI